MRPPILWIAVGFATGLWAGLTALPLWWSAGVLVIGAVLCVRRAPVAGACAVAALAGALWGATARAERSRTCAGRWAADGSREQGAGSGASPLGEVTRAARVRLLDNVGGDGGVVDAVVRGGSCGGTLRVRWPEGRPAAGGTEWVVAGRWLGTAERGVLAARHVRLAEAIPRGRGALRGAVAARSAALFGSRAPLVDALVIGRRAEMAPEVRERFARSGLTHLLSISGLHVGFIAAWLAVLLRRTRLRARTQVAVGGAAIASYIWLLGAPAPAVRAALMLAIDGVGRLRQRAVAPRGSIGLAVLLLLLIDPWALRSIGAWLSVAAIGAVIWADRACRDRSPLVRALASGATATLATAPITAYSFGTVA